MLVVVLDTPFSLLKDFVRRFVVFFNFVVALILLRSSSVNRLGVIGAEELKFTALA